jgi:uncharacterized protein
MNLMSTRIKPLVLIVTLLVIAGTGLGFAPDVDKGWEAYNEGDYNGALAHLYPLAIMGDSDAQASLGYMYTYTEFDDKEFPRDPEKAIHWYKKAAKQGNGNSALEVAYWLTEGEGGVEQNYVEAIKWFRIAADQRLEDAPTLLAEIYRDGLGDVPRDLMKARFWFEEAVKYRDADPAQLELGRIYETAYENPYSAYKWYWLHGGDEAKARMEVLANELGSERIERIIEGAKKWQYDGGYSVPIEYQSLWNEWRLNEGRLELIKVESPIYKEIELKGMREMCGTPAIQREAQIKEAIAAGAPVDYVASLVREGKDW